MGFSRKHALDPYSRFLEIIHIKNSIEVFSERPCKDIWIGRDFIENLNQDIRWACRHKVTNRRFSRDTSITNNLTNLTNYSTLDPTKILWALMDGSICIPGPRCIKIKVSTSLATGFIDQKKKVMTSGTRGNCRITITIYPVWCNKCPIVSTDTILRCTDTSKGREVSYKAERHCWRKLWEKEQNDGVWGATVVQNRNVNHRSR